MIMFSKNRVREIRAMIILFASNTKQQKPHDWNEANVSIIKQPPCHQFVNPANDLLDIVFTWLLPRRFASPRLLPLSTHFILRNTVTEWCAIFSKGHFFSNK